MSAAYSTPSAMQTSCTGATPGAWFLGGDAPSLVDLHFIVSVERLLASCLYWHGLALRDGAHGLGHVIRWLDAFDARMLRSCHTSSSDPPLAPASRHLR